MIMRLDYDFELDGKNYNGVGVDVGDTDDIKAAKEDIKSCKTAAICHEFDLTYGYDDEKIEELYKKAKFAYCELD